jgi:hypothetical protein
VTRTEVCEVSATQYGKSETVIISFSPKNGDRTVEDAGDELQLVCSQFPLSLVLERFDRNSNNMCVCAELYCLCDQHGSRRVINQRM